MTARKTIGVSREMPVEGHMRDMCTDDIDAILKIEEKSFLAPWSRRIFEETLLSPISRCLVLECDGATMGYLVFYFVDVEAHILNIAVHPGQRKMGWARRMLNHAVGFFRENDISECYLEVRETNKDAQKLYKQFGFEVIGKRKRYYTENGEDALVMQLFID